MSLKSHKLRTLLLIVLYKVQNVVLINKHIITQRYNLEGKQKVNKHEQSKSL